MTEAKVFTDRSNAARAAKRAIDRGEAPAMAFEIVKLAAGGFVIEWPEGEKRAKAQGKPPASKSVERPTAAAPAKKATRRPAASAGLPPKPVIASASPQNRSYQGKIDRIHEAAEAGDAAELKRLAVSGTNTYAKMAERHRTACLAAIGGAA